MCGGQRRAAVPLKGTAARRIAKPRTAAQNRAPVAPSRLKNQVCSQTVQILRILFRHLRSVSKSTFAAGIRHAGAGNRAIPFLWICFLYSTVFAVCKDKKGDSFLNCPRIVIMTLSMCASWHSPECEASGTAVSTRPPQCRSLSGCAPRCQARQAAEPKQRSRSHTSFPNRFR